MTARATAIIPNLSVCALVALAAGCAYAPPTEQASAQPATQPATQARCEALVGADLAGALGVPVVIDAASIEAGEWQGRDLPEHCHVTGRINPRQSEADGGTYAIAFAMRLPLGEAWNGRFLQLGGGGSNGADPTALDTIFASAETPLLRGFAVIDTDGGHNASNADPMAGGGAAFGRDPQARRDHFFNAYDKVAQAGRELAANFYDAPFRSYFAGCSEGGREAMLMSQRFPDHFDGILAGAPQFLQPMQSLSSVRGLQSLAKGAKAQGLYDPDGMPAIHRLFSDADLGLAARAVADVCDAADGLADGLVSNFGQCGTDTVLEEMRKLTCTAEKTDACLTAAQIDTLAALHAPTRNAQGEMLYYGYPWDIGITAQSAGFRAWWLGDFAPARSNSVKLHFSPNMLRMVWIDPAQPFDVADAPTLSLGFDWQSMPGDPALAYPAANGNPDDAAGIAMVNDSIDLDRFAARGGKLLLWTGAADATHSLYQSTDYMDRLGQRYGDETGDLARLFVAPGVAHCRGGVGPERADLLSELIEWVEQGDAPERIVAASAPSADRAAYTRPLCPYPSYSRYLGGDENDAASFACVKPGAGE